MDDLFDFTVPASATLIEAVGAIEKNKSRAVVVVDGPKAVGILSEGDIMRALLHGTDMHAPVDEFMNVGFKYLTGRGANRAAALDYFRRFGITMVPVVDDEFHLVGVLTLNDVLAHADTTEQQGP